MTSQISSTETAERRTAPTFSIIIPTYNEITDIEKTLETVVKQERPAHEVIVVDGGSTDGTLDVLRLWEKNHGITVLAHGRDRGVAQARNRGLRSAAGEVVVILNADVHPAPDFLERLAEVYRQGFDCVSVESLVENEQYVIGRFRQADHDYRYHHVFGWTEGFSCRRELALRAGFPDQLPGAGGEDGEFFQRLIRLGSSWTGAYCIAVSHVVPDRLGELWKQFHSRGKAVPYKELYLQHRSVGAITLRRAGAAVKTSLLIVALAPYAWNAIQCARRSREGWRDLPAFWFLCHVQTFAHRLGEWQTVVQLWGQGRNPQE